MLLVRFLVILGLASDDDYDTDVSSGSVLAADDIFGDTADPACTSTYRNFQTPRAESGRRHDRPLIDDNCGIFSFSSPRSTHTAFSPAVVVSSQPAAPFPGFSTPTATQKTSSTPPSSSNPASYVSNGTQTSWLSRPPSPLTGWSILSATAEECFSPTTTELDGLRNQIAMSEKTIAALEAQLRAAESSPRNKRARSSAKPTTARVRRPATSDSGGRRRRRTHTELTMETGIRFGYIDQVPNVSIVTGEPLVPGPGPVEKDARMRRGRREDEDDGADNEVMVFARGLTADIWRRKRNRVMGEKAGSR